MKTITKAFRKLYGKPCWGTGWHPSPKLNFGKPHLEIREPRSLPPRSSISSRKLLSRRKVTVQGEWRLLIWYCHWKIFSKSKLLATDSSSDKKIEVAVHSLCGERLTKVHIDSNGRSTMFVFDLGGVVETRGIGKSDQWLLYEPSGYVLVLRGDGLYHHQRGNVSRDKLKWRALET